MAQDIKYLDKQGLISVWAKIKQLFSLKVDKEQGKGLSSNDYTNEEKTKLQGVAEGATANIGTITEITMNGASVGTSGNVNLGSVITDVSDKADKRDTVLLTTLSRGRRDNVTVGTASFAFGYNTIASGNYSHSEGSSTEARGFASHAEGYETVSSAHSAHAEGYRTRASYDYTHAEGVTTVASGLSSHAEGDSTTASGSRSHAEGLSTLASGSSSHTEGYLTEASGQCSHAEGYESKASGHFSHTEGQATTASDSWAHAEGYRTKALGVNSHAEGCGGTYTSGQETFTSSAGGEADHVEGFQCLTIYNDNSTAGSHAEG